MSVPNAKPDVVRNHARTYGVTSERPYSLYTVLADAFLDVLDHVWMGGLAKTYVRRKLISASPFGRIDTYRTSVSTLTKGRPMAEFNAFMRTTDFGPNRFIKLALRRLLAFYQTRSNVAPDTRQRRRHIADAMAHLRDVSYPEATDAALATSDRRLSGLYAIRPAYKEALRLATLINGGRGFSVRTAGKAVLPVVLVNMADVFEKYARDALRRHIEASTDFRVRDGNICGEAGARTRLFSNISIAGVLNPAVTPDIVIARDNTVLAVLDVKYRPGKHIPDRADINQVVCYGVRYGCTKVMIVYPSSADGSKVLWRIGTIGGIDVFGVALDLSVADLAQQEKLFADAVAQEVS